MLLLLGGGSKGGHRPAKDQGSTAKEGESTKGHSPGSSEPGESMSRRGFWVQSSGGKIRVRKVKWARPGLGPLGGCVHSGFY